MESSISEAEIVIRSTKPFEKESAMSALPRNGALPLPQIGVVGSGMIMEDQNGPAIAQMVCRGLLGQVHIAAQGSASLRKLLGLPWWSERFPELPPGWVTTYPPL